MGTDIHGFIQRRYDCERYETIGEIEDERCYRVFAMLAGVRNGFGFAGVKTHEPLIPISAPRGLPDDLGWKDRFEGIENSATDVYFGDHSFSWVTLKEVMDWPYWDAPLQMTGIVERVEYERMQRDGDTPRDWMGGVWGKGVVVVTPEEATSSDASWTHVKCAWSEPFRAGAETFRRWIDYLASKYGWLIERDSDAIRLVFGFDS